MKKDKITEILITARSSSNRAIYMSVYQKANGCFGGLCNLKVGDKIYIPNPPYAKEPEIRIVSGFAIWHGSREFMFLEPLPEDNGVHKYCLENTLGRVEKFKKPAKRKSVKKKIKKLNK